VGLKNYYHPHVDVAQVKTVRLLAGVSSLLSLLCRLESEMAAHQLGTGGYIA
jgi:hypothetical protein